MSCNQTLEPVDPSDFEFVQMNEQLHDKELETKPVGFLRDALRRFCRNGGSVVCFCILMCMVVFAVVTPFVSAYEVSEKDGYYAYALPRLSTRFDLGFWNGCSTKQVNQQTYDYYSAIPGAIAKLYGTEEKNVANRVQTVYNLSVDSYARVGYVLVNLTEKELQDALAYQEETGIQLLYPVINEKKIKCANYKSNPNAWFLTNAKGVAERDANGELQNTIPRPTATPTMSAR